MTLVTGFRTVHRLRGWFWKLHDKSLDPAWLVATTAAVVLLAMLAHRLRARPLAALSCVFALAAVSQFGLARAEGRGLDALRERAAFGGHGEFGRTAAEGVPASEVLTDYESLAARVDHPFFAVKPPGLLLTYVALDRLAQRLVPADALERAPTMAALPPRRRQLIELMAWLLPWVAALAVLPIGLVVRVLSPNAHWLATALLFAMSAPLALITLHMDQVVYPGAVAALWYCSLRAGLSQARAWAWGVAAGQIAWLMAFVSFGLLPAVALAPCMVAAIAPHRRWRRTTWFLASLVATTAALWCVFALAFGYDPVLRYERALAAHSAWKHWSWDLGAVLAATRINLVEFGWWANPALIVAWISGAAAALRRLWQRSADGPDHLVLAVTVLIAAMATIGQTFAETARLWLFILPLVLWTAVRALGELPGRTLALLCGLQWVWTVSLKHAQDFF